MSQSKVGQNFGTLYYRNFAEHEHDSKACNHCTGLFKVTSYLSARNKLLRHQLQKEKLRRDNEFFIILKFLSALEKNVKDNVVAISRRLNEQDIRIHKLLLINRDLQMRIRQSNKRFQESKDHTKSNHYECKEKCQPLTVTMHENAQSDIDDDQKDADDSTRTLNTSEVCNQTNCAMTSPFHKNIESTSEKLFEKSSDNWYASASDGEDSTMLLNSLAKTPMLERVNQILSQQIEEPVNCDASAFPQKYVEAEPRDYKCNVAKAPNNMRLTSPTNTFKVKSSSSKEHCNEKDTEDHIEKLENCLSKENQQNSYVDNIDKRKCCFSIAGHTNAFKDSREPLECAQNTNIESNKSIENNCFLLTSSDSLIYESISSNKYEPILSVHNNSDTYVDMNLNVNTPPALPPKPGNLLEMKQTNDLIHRYKSACDSESDYCSVAGMHVENNGVEYILNRTANNKMRERILIKEGFRSHPLTPHKVFESFQEKTQPKETDDNEEIFADVPKLPNVEAIIAPRKSLFLRNTDKEFVTVPYKKYEKDVICDSSFDKLLLKSESHAKANSSGRNSKGKTSPSEPNIVPTMCVDYFSKRSNVAQMQNVKYPTKKKILTLLQTEFDWYNLDFEFHD